MQTLDWSSREILEMLPDTMVLPSCSFHYFRVLLPAGGHQNSEALFDGLTPLEVLFFGKDQSQPRAVVIRAT